MFFFNEDFSQVFTLKFLLPVKPFTEYYKGN